MRPAQQLEPYQVRNGPTDIRKPDAQIQAFKAQILSKAPACLRPASLQVSWQCERRMVKLIPALWLMHAFETWAGSPSRKYADMTKVLVVAA